MESTLGKSQQIFMPKKMDVITENPYSQSQNKFSMNMKSSIKIPQD
jgi:hypothetical protein